MLGFYSLCSDASGLPHRLSECPLKYILRKEILELVLATHKASARQGENSGTHVFLPLVFCVSPDIQSSINFWSFMAFRNFISQAVCGFDLPSDLFPTPTEFPNS